MSAPLSTAQAMRYNRQIVLPQFDLQGQEALAASRVLVIGVGGLGCACAQYLASSGIGHLTLVDPDQVDEHNLQRQILHTEESVGVDKVDSATQRLQALNSNLSLTGINQKLDDVALAQQIAQHQLVIDCSDNLDTRQQVNRLCVDGKKPLIWAAAIRMEGQLGAYFPDQHSACYQCLSQLFGPQQLSCTESGILAPVVGVMGSMQALEALKYLAMDQRSLANSLLLFDATSLQWQRFDLPSQSGCEVCAKQPGEN